MTRSCRLVLLAATLAVLPPAARAEPELSVRLTHRARVVAVAFAPDGQTLITGGGFHEGAVRVWDAAGKIVTQFSDHTGGVSAVAFAPDGQTLATGGWDGEILFWEPATGKRLGRLPTDRPGITCLGYSPDGKTFAAATVQHTVFLHDPATGKELHRLALSGTSETVTVFAFSPDSKLLAVLDRGKPGEVCVWNVATGQDRLRFTSAAPLESVVFSPDGRFLAGETAHGQVVLFDAATGKARRTMGQEAEKKGAIIAARLAFSPDGRLLALGQSDGYVSLIELTTGTERCREPLHEAAVSCVAFAPDGRSLLTGGHDGTAHLRGLDDLGDDRPLPAALAADDLPRLWEELKGEGPTAYRALRLLGARPASAVPFLATQLKPVPPIEAARVAKLIGELDNPRFAVRQKAGEELEVFGEQIAPALRAALKDQPSLEVTRRLEQILAHIEDVALPAGRVRHLRGIEALERADTPAARELLARLAGGAAGIRETEEARAALARLQRRAR